MKEVNVLSFSGGRTSAFMLSLYKDEIDYVIFCNTGKEAEGTLDFVRKCGEYFEKDIIWLEYTTDNDKKFNIVDYKTASRKGEPFEKLIFQNTNFLPSMNARYCTRELKVKTMRRYLKSLKIDLNYVNMYLGIRKDEQRRYFKIKDNTKDQWNRYMPLYKDGYTLDHVMEYWSKQPFDLDIPTHLGNCDLCFNKKTSKKQYIIRHHPEVLEWWINIEKITGKTFNKDISYEQLVDLTNNQIDLFSTIDDIECHCNID